MPSMQIRRTYRVPLLLFTFALFADHLITQRGLAAGGTEGDIVVIWLWNVLPFGPSMLVMLWWLLVIGIALLLSPFSIFVGRWWLYGAFIGHLSGFLSWTPVLHIPVQRVWELFGQQWGLAFLLACAGAVGLLLAAVHSWLTRRT
jgi:hypothetical protein